MKNRDYKNFGVGSIVHVFNRGNNKEKIFYDEKDYAAFILRISLALGYTQQDIKNVIDIPNTRIRISPSDKNAFKLHAFCLMPNHFHLLVEQCGDATISSLLSKVSTSFSMYINKRHGRVGHVFQDQFKSVLVDSNEQLMWVSAYIHTNPVKDNIVKDPREYKWSSYKEFIGERNLIIVNKDLVNSVFENNFVKETLNLSLKDSIF